MGLDFHGFGHSDRYPEMDEDAVKSAPLLVAEDAARQVEAAARFILAHHGHRKLSIIAHSWGSMPTCRFAADHPALIDRLVLFGPLARRTPPGNAALPKLPGWRVVTLEDQWKRFIEDVPPHEPPVLSRKHFDEWGERYLDSDPLSRSREPFGVRTPVGPFSEILRASQGQLAYDPSAVRAPVAIIRGEWDSLCNDADARWLFDAFTRSPVKRDIKISRATHLMNLEVGRLALWEESIGFLNGADPAPVLA